MYYVVLVHMCMYVEKVENVSRRHDTVAQCVFMREKMETNENSTILKYR